MTLTKTALALRRLVDARESSAIGKAKDLVQVQEENYQKDQEHPNSAQKCRRLQRDCNTKALA